MDGVTVDGERDWVAEIDAWTERFRAVADPPEPFATALRTGWDPAVKQRLAVDAAAYHARQRAYMAQLAASGVELVRLDEKDGNCGVCRPYDGCGYSLRGETEGLPPPPPMPICPACRHTLSLLTPFFLQSLDRTVDDVVADSVPFTPPD